ncbi:Uncharacterised protein [Nocardia brasiliensis]|nr:Uncharacterised protein [Nocardia brasiliensis]
MNIRVASAIFGLLLLAVAVGWCALPDIPTTTPQAAVHVETTNTAPEGSAVPGSTIILGFMISGAAMIGLMFFSPQTPKGPRGGEALSAVQLRNSFVECARRGLADLHQELEVVLGLLQTVDQQIDRLVRVQAGQYAAQLVQHRRLVGAEQ